MQQESIQLYEHNKKTLQEVLGFVNRRKDCCVVNPCGSGKSAVMTAIVQNYSSKRFLILTKQKNAASYYAKTYGKILSDIKTVTYAKMLRDVKNNRFADYNADIYLVDEAHYVGAPEWNNAFLELKAKFNPVMVGFTATPQRFFDQGTDETIVTKYFSGHYAGNFTTKDLQKAGLFIEPEYVVSLYNLEDEVARKLEILEDSDISEAEKKRWYARLNDLLDTWNRTDSPEKILKTYLPKYMYFDRGNKIVVYASNYKDLSDKEKIITPIIKSIFPDKKVTSYLYSYKNDKTLAEFEDDFESYIRILYSINKIMETVHMDDLNILIMLRPSVSDRIITQQYGRINNANNDRRCLVLDMVANIDNLGSLTFVQTSGAEQRVSDDRKNGGDVKAKTLNISIKPISRYANVFEEIENATNRRRQYTYNGYTGSADFLCGIYNKKLSDVKKYMSEYNHTFKEAFELAPSRKELITEEIIGGYCKHPDTTMPEENKKYFDKVTEITTRYIKCHGINDEADVKQELYLFAYEALAKYTPEKGQISIFMLLRIRRAHCHILRIKRLHEEYVSNPESDEIFEIPPDIDEEKVKIPIEEIHALLSGLTVREQTILDVRFGLTDGHEHTLEETGKQIGITRERVRQLEAKALRKLKNPEFQRNILKDTLWW